MDGMRDLHPPSQSPAVASERIKGTKSVEAAKAAGDALVTVLVLNDFLSLTH